MLIGLFWPCMFVADELMRFPTVKHSYGRLSQSDAANGLPLPSKSVSRCRESFQSQKLTGDFADGVFEIGH